MGKGINIIKTDCDLEAASDKSLPTNAYLVKYADGGEEKYDIVAGLQVDIFDQYWDKYGDVRGISWTEGRVNPKMWGYQIKDSGKKKK